MLLKSELLIIHWNLSRFYNALHCVQHGKICAAKHDIEQEPKNL